MQVVTAIAGELLMDGPVGPLEVRIESARAADIGVDLVICHPHPLHGGTFDNKVVHTLARAGRDIGMRAIRFNFRGVGKSAGVHDDGRGEVDDLLAIIDGCHRAAPERQVVLAGFSFGAWVAASAAMQMQNGLSSSSDLRPRAAPPKALLLVAPPVQYPVFDSLNHFEMPVRVIQGDDDDVVDPDEVVDWCASRQPPIDCRLLSAGHFFHGQLPELKDETAGWLPAALSPPPREQ